MRKWCVRLGIPVLAVLAIACSVWAGLDISAASSQRIVPVVQSAEQVYTEQIYHEQYPVVEDKQIIIEENGQHLAKEDGQYLLRESEQDAVQPTQQTYYEQCLVGENEHATELVSADWLGQTFTPAVSHKITRVWLKLNRYGSPGTVTVSIRATDGGLPVGLDLCSGTTNGNGLTLGYTGVGWTGRTVTLGGGHNLVAGTTYAIVCRALNGQPTINYANWAHDAAGGVYVGGEAVISGDSGVSWEKCPSPPVIGVWDFVFEEGN